MDGKPDVGKFSDHYTGMVAADAQRREREAAVPEKYDFALPADMKFEGMDLPEDFSVNVAEGFEPLFGELGGVLKELGAPAEAAGKLTGLLARYEAQKASTEFANWKTDMATLGTPEQQSARAKNVQRALQTKLPAAEAEALFSGPRISAAGIRALEKLLSGTNLSTPTTPPPNAADEALTPMERLKRANMKK
ncbi:MAG: hypothetical protein DI533_00400 [Cereibacter sphaeroides]|uniref:Uncharacterized protein n=1 Tax=Cereibacter sphaeroides TaxID=1063 RepID=A0A2W5U6X9_CERSP|nr:MAG: hypothetical protein DI533_00400 [Cereibacter sphaeroides]